MAVAVVGGDPTDFKAPLKHGLEQRSLSQPQTISILTLYFCNELLLLNKLVTTYLQAAVKVINPKYKEKITPAQHREFEFDN
jgi:hypothetical protein